MSTDLIEKLGNLVDTEIAQHIVEGSYEVQDEIDEATAEIFKEIEAMGVEISNRKVSIIFTPEEFKKY